MITTISKELEDSPTNKEEENHHTRDGLKINKASSSSSQSPWLRLKDPRIVRVSRAFGGKDRHSKVCTIKGLRDRRVRLSVPTAIQLYDLQDRLGLNQPSKVVDWLLNVAKHEIDELPPLPISPINFTLNHLTNFSPQSNKQGFKMNNLEDEDFCNETLLRAKSKQVSRDDQKENWIKRTENKDEQEGNEGQQLVHSSQSGLMNNNNTLVVPYGTSSFFQLDHHSNFGGGFASQNADHHELHNLNAMPLHPSALSLSSSSLSGSHVFVPQPLYFPVAHLASSDDHNADPRQMNNFQMFSSSSTQNLFPNSFTQNPYNSMNQSSGSVRGFNFNIAPRLFNSNNEAADNKDQDLE